MIKDDTPQAQFPPEETTKLKEHHDKFLEYLRIRDFKELVQVSAFFTKWLSSQQNSKLGTPPEIIDLIPQLLNLLSDDFLEHKILQLEITDLLAKICTGTSNEAQKLVDLGAIPVLAHAYESAYDGGIQENIMQTLANIAGESNLHYRDQILEQGVLNMVIKSFGMKPQRIAYYRTASWLISNLVREKTFAALAQLIEYPDEIIQQYTLLSLTYLSEEAKGTHVKSLSEYDLVTRIVKFISSKNEKIAINAVKVAGNLAKGNKGFLHNLYDDELFQTLPTVLESPNADLRRNACVMLSNILGNEFDDHDYLEDSETLDSLIKLAAEDKESNVRAQALLCLQKYLESATTEYAITAIEKGAVEAFLENLESDDVEVIGNSIRGLYKALEQGEMMKNENGGTNIVTNKIMKNGSQKSVEALQTHPREDIALQAGNMWRKFFEKDLLL